MKIQTVSGNIGTVTMFIEKSEGNLNNSMQRIDFKLQVIQNKDTELNVVYYGRLQDMKHGLRVELLNPEFIKLDPSFTHIAAYTVVCKNTWLIDEYFAAHVYNGEDKPGGLVRDNEAERNLLLNGTWNVKIKEDE